MYKEAYYELDVKTHRLLFINIPGERLSHWEFFSLCDILIYRKVKSYHLRILKGDKNG